MSRHLDIECLAGKAVDVEAEDVVDVEDDDAELPVVSKDYKYKAGIVHVIMDEESLKVRRKLTRGTASLKQVETLHVVCSGNLTLPDRQGKNYPGSNKGTAIGPVTLADPDEEWSATVKEKRTLYGKRFRIAVGGKTEGTSAEKRNDTDREPVFFWSYPQLFYEEILHRFFGRAVFDMTPGPGSFGEVCLKQRTGYFALAMTESHAACLLERFELAALRYMTVSGNTHYQSRCAEALGVAAPVAKTKAKAKVEPAPKKPKPAAGEPAPKKKNKNEGSGAPKKKKHKKDDDEGVASSGEPGASGDSSWDLSDDEPKAA
jgi:hypothetical protein